MALLAVSDLTVRFGGLVAVNRLGFTVGEGEVRGLIGPNGSGKTSTLNAISGFYTPASGSVVLNDRDVVGRPPHEIAACGLTRTFQNLRVFPGLSVLDNILVGGHLTGRATVADVIARPGFVIREERALRGRARDICGRVGLRGLEGVSCGSLPYGVRRLVEIGRALMARPRLLMLDEPTVGMTSEETDRVKELVGGLRAEKITALLVGHDMKMIMSVCDTITVLNQGEKIAEGAPAEIQRNPAVIEAYLGAGEDDA